MRTAAWGAQCACRFSDRPGLCASDREAACVVYGFAYVVLCAPRCGLLEKEGTRSGYEFAACGR